MTKGILSYKGTPKEIRKYMSEMGKKGANSRWKNVSEQDRAKEMSRIRNLGIKKANSK